MEVRDIVRMANQITDFFAVYPKQEALDGIAKHIHATWEPRLQRAEGAPRHRRSRIEASLHRGDERILQGPEQPERPTC